MVRSVTVLALAAAALAPGAAGAAPIPQDPKARDLPAYAGRPASPRLLPVPAAPRHPFMAPNGRSNLHADAYQSDTYRIAGPLGRSMQVLSTLQTADCASVTFDSRGRIVTVCVGLEGPRLELFDPRTLAEIARMQLPPRIPGAGNILTDFSGGGYFYLDQRDRAVVPTTTRHIWVVAAGADSFTQERDYDLTGSVPAGDKIISALPDWSGRLWFASVKGIVGTVDPAGGAVRVRDLGEGIANSFAVDEEGGVYVVTDAALYRLEATPAGQPDVVWREPYRNSGVQKPGQSSAGSGTTPTVMSKGRVAITDNADPMDVVVVRKARSVRGSRRICEQPVFERGASATDQSLIAAGDSLVVENNYGYSSPTAVNDGKTTTPGLERIDVGTSGCRRAWRSSEIAPSVVPKVSLANGLVYTYTKPARSDGVDAWYLTALDFCDGRTVYRRLAGTGLGYNNHYAPVSIGPDGSAYVGTLGGLVLLRDARRPSGPAGGFPRGCPSRRAPRLTLSVRYRRGHDRLGRRCARRGPIVARLGGRDLAGVRRVAFRLGRRRSLLDSRAPFARVVDRSRHRGRSHRHRVAARVLMADGRRALLRRTVRVCAAG